MSRKMSGAPGYCNDNRGAFFMFSKENEKEIEPWRNDMFSKRSNEMSKSKVSEPNTECTDNTKVDLISGNLKLIYNKYLWASFGGALISSIYSVVDMAMVGNYQGPDGTAALACASPIWSILYSLGFLMGIGGSVIFSTLKGQSSNNKHEADEYYTSALIGTSMISAVIWIILIFFDKEILMLFGAKGNLLTIAREYIKTIRYVAPLFLFNQTIAAFLRNDGAPELATKSVIIGGFFNVFGDYFFVFTMNWGAYGAGLATALGSILSFLLMLTHFTSGNKIFGFIPTKRAAINKNTLCLVRPEHFLRKFVKIFTTGFSTFFIDIALGIMNIMFNRQIIRYLGTDALSVYAIIINITCFVQCCSYSIGQAVQPVISANLGAGRGSRIRIILKYSLFTAALFSLFWTVLSFAAPNFYTHLFMKPTQAVLDIAPGIIRKYSISYILLPLNVFSTYYFQALMKQKTAFTVSVSRGIIISGILVFAMPALLGADSIWFVMPLTEMIVAIYVIFMMVRYTRQLHDVT